MPPVLRHVAMKTNTLQAAVLVKATVFTGHLTKSVRRKRPWAPDAYDCKASGECEA